jgi:hypothetical protein
VSFGTYARKVRDPALRYGQRINALAGCVELYRPIGYSATFGYLEGVAGSFRRDGEALIRALDALSTSRDLWLEDLAAYGDQRRVAKRLGRRRPGANEINPNWPACWYGDMQPAALFTIGYLLRSHDRTARADPDVVRLASTVLEAGGALTVGEREWLHALRQRFERLRNASAWPTMDLTALYQASESLWIVQQIFIARTDAAGTCVPQEPDGVTAAPAAGPGGTEPDQAA